MGRYNREPFTSTRARPTTTATTTTTSTTTTTTATTTEQRRTMGQKWENREFSYPADGSRKVIVGSVLTVYRPSGKKEICPGRWINDSVFACGYYHPVVGTWHAQFDAKGALTWSNPKACSEVKDAEVLSWRRYNREPFTSTRARPTTTATTTTTS